MTTHIYRYEVPVDDQWHPIDCSAVLHVASRDPRTVEFWAHPLPEGERPIIRAYRVYGTGQEIPDRGLMYAGTALAPGGLVWHLMSKWVKA